MPAKKGKRMTSAEAVANELGWDIVEVKDARYHYGFTSIPVYTAGDYYYCATSIGGKPATRYLENDGWKWVVCEPNHPINEQASWNVWKAHMNK